MLNLSFQDSKKMASSSSQTLTGRLSEGVRHQLNHLLLIVEIRHHLCEMSCIGYTLSTSCRETGIKIIVEKDDEGCACIMSSCTQVKDVYAMDHVQPAMIGSQSHYGRLDIILLHICLLTLVKATAILIPWRHLRDVTWCD
jgi:hypothetical protein